MARFYTNENIPLQVVVELRRLGHNVVSSLDVGMANSAVPDADVLAFAVANGRILLTHNRTFDPDFCRQAQRIDDAVGAEPEMANKLVRVNRPG